MTSASPRSASQLAQSIKHEARRLGFVLAGVTTPDPPPHTATLERWVAKGLHGSMQYMADPRMLLLRREPGALLPGCKSILMLGAPYNKPGPDTGSQVGGPDIDVRGRIAAYAWGRDYHDELPERMRQLVKFIEASAGEPVNSRCFTDSAPILERDLAQRAGLGWIGKNTCLINPRRGSYLLLAEILLTIELEPDPPFVTDHCGTCKRCIEACPTDCILPDRTLDARRCISYLTIEERGSIPEALRPLMTGWIFGCDICQMVCPWNRFAPGEGDEAFLPNEGRDDLRVLSELPISREDFKLRHGASPLSRAKHEGYIRNLAVAAGTEAGVQAIPLLNQIASEGTSVVQEHAEWAISQIKKRHANTPDRNE